MIRKIVKIDNEKCNGCASCVRACHEGAIEMINGKAKLTREDYCDGLGDCLPKCPAGAITFEEREAPAYDHAAVLASKQKNWPLQIRLVPVSAPYFDGARLLIAADCTAFAYANFYEDFQKGKVTLIGCPKLDAVDYSVKLTEILKYNDIHSITVLRMEVPCCKGLEIAVKKALQDSGKSVSCQVLILSTHGSILPGKA